MALKWDTMWRRMLVADKSCFRCDIQDACAHSSVQSASMTENSNCRLIPTNQICMLIWVEAINCIINYAYAVIGLTAASDVGHKRWTDQISPQLFTIAVCYLRVFVHLTDLTPINHLRVCAGQNTLTFLLRFCTHSQSRRKTRNKTCTFRSNRPFDASQSTINYRTWHRRHSLRCDLVAAQHAPAPASHICPKRRWQNSLVYCSSVWLACTQRNVHHSAYA